MEIVKVNKEYLSKQRKEFREILNRASDKVKTQPKWKQDIEISKYSSGCYGQKMEQK